MKKNTQIPSIPENAMIELKKAQKALLNRIKKDYARIGHVKQ
jgi:hypothetical protein